METTQLAGEAVPEEIDEDGRDEAPLYPVGVYDDGSGQWDGWCPAGPMPEDY